MLEPKASHPRIATLPRRARRPPLQRAGVGQGPSRLPGVRPASPLRHARTRRASSACSGTSALESERLRAMGKLKRLTSLSTRRGTQRSGSWSDRGDGRARHARHGVASGRCGDGRMAVAQTLVLATLVALAGKANLNVRCGIGLDGRRTEGVTWDGGEGRPWTARAIRRAARRHWGLGLRRGGSCQRARAHRSSGLTTPRGPRSTMCV
jgi:hypothetical protein